MATPADIFAGICKRFKPDEAGDMNSNVVFDLAGDDGGQWTVQINNGACSVEEGAVANPKATVHMSADDYVAMMTGNLNPMMAFMSGKVKVEGDLNTVMKLQQVFEQ